MAYTMVIYRSKVSDGYTLPYVPAGGLSVSSGQDTKDYSGVQMNYTIPKAVSPKEFTIKLTWPVTKRSWMNSASVASPHKFLAWAEKHRAARNYFRCIVTATSGATIISGTFFMPKLDWEPMQNGDLEISMSFVQFNAASTASPKSGTTNNSGGTAAAKITAAAMANDFVGAAKIAQKSSSKMKTQVKAVIAAAKKRSGYSTALANEAAALAIAIMKTSKYSRTVRELFYKTYKGIINTNKITVSSLALQLVEAATLAGVSSIKMKVRIKAIMIAAKKQSGYSRTVAMSAYTLALSQLLAEGVGSKTRELFSKTFADIMR